MRRAQLIEGIRRFFVQQGYLEVETPILLPTIAPEIHIEPHVSGRFFLQTSPELCMKRMLAGGHTRIYQIARCFRRGERGRLHLPEFTMLEWYRVDADYFDLMEECEDLFLYLLGSLGLEQIISYGGHTITLEKSWERITVAEAFLRFSPISMADALAAGSFDEILVQYLEPHLGMRAPTFLYDYPASLASLARTKEDDPSVAERFEVYVAGIEMANGFSELTDATEQRRRFEQERESIRSQGRDPGMLPEKFLHDLSGMPDAAGIALGVDRLVMLFIGSTCIDEVVSFTPEEL